MNPVPATTVDIIGIELVSDSKVCICLRVMVDVNRLADVSSQLFRMSVKRTRKKTNHKSTAPKNGMPLRQFTD